MKDGVLDAPVEMSTMKDILGQASPNLAERLLKFEFNTGATRPWKCPATGRSYVTITNAGPDGKPKQQHFLVNANATLTKNEWELLDNDVSSVAKAEVGVFDIVASKGNVVNIKNPLGVTKLTHQNGSDINDAVISMSPVKVAERDRQEFEEASIPFPIIHKDLSFDIRQVAQSRRQGEAIDTSMSGLCTEKVIVARDKLYAGTWTPNPVWAGLSLPGLLNYTSRLTGSLSDPAGVGWVPEDLDLNIEAMLEALRLTFQRGPFIMLHNNSLNQYLNRQYSSAYGSGSLRSKILEKPQISGIYGQDYITTGHIVLLSTKPSTVQSINGMPPTPIQWEEMGGLLTRVKIWCMQVPRLRKDFNGSTGIADYSY